MHVILQTFPAAGQSADHQRHTHKHTLNGTTGGDHFSVLTGADDANMRLERNPLSKPIAHFVMPGDMDYVVDWMFP